MMIPATTPQKPLRISRKVGMITLPLPPRLASSLSKNSLSKKTNDDSSIDDKDRKLPAKRNTGKGDSSDDDEDRKLPAKRDTGKGDAMHSIDEVDGDNDGGLDAFISASYEDHDPNGDDDERHDAAQEDGDGRGEVPAPAFYSQHL